MVGYVGKSVGYVGKSVGYVGESVGYVGEIVGYAAITHTFQPMKSIRSDVPWYKYYWRASEASETLSGLFNRESRIYI